MCRGGTRPARKDDRLSVSDFQWHEDCNECTCPDGKLLRSEWRQFKNPRIRDDDKVLGPGTALHLCDLTPRRARTPACPLPELAIDPYTDRSVANQQRQRLQHEEKHEVLHAFSAQS